MKKISKISITALTTFMLIGTSYAEVVIGDGATLATSDAFAIMSPGDIYVQVEGIPGEARDQTYHGDLEGSIVRSRFSSFNPGLAGIAGTLGDVLRSDYQDFTISKYLDKASPKLNLQCCNGKRLGKVKIDICRQVNSKLTIQTYELEGALVRSVRGGTDEKPTEEVSLAYEKITMKYTEVDAKANKPTGDSYWDVLTNTGGFRGGALDTHGGSLQSTWSIRDSDIYIEVEGIPGEATDKAHKGWIRALSLNHGISQPRGALDSAGGGARGGISRSEYQDFTISKYLDKASPKLNLQSRNGKRIGKVKIDICRQVAPKIVYQSYELEGALVRSVSIRAKGPGSGGDEQPTEEIALAYEKITMKYPGEPATERQRRAAILKLDRNKNRRFDKAEGEAAILVLFDKNGDGQLGIDERATLNRARAAVRMITVGTGNDTTLTKIDSDLLNLYLGVRGRIFRLMNPIPPLYPLRNQPPTVTPPSATSEFR